MVAIFLSIFNVFVIVPLNTVTLVLQVVSTNDALFAPQVWWPQYGYRKKADFLSRYLR